MKIKSIQIDSFKILKNFYIDFCTDEKVNPITLLVGTNGSGKTTLLDFIANALFKNTMGEANNSSIIEYESDQEIPGTPNPYFFLTEDIMKIRRKAKDTSLSKNLIYYRAGQENPKSKESIIKYIDKLIYEKDVRGSEAYSQLKDKVSSLFDRLSLQINFDRLDKDKELYFSNGQTDLIKLNDLSGGEKEIITKALPLFLDDVKESVILIDEPESSLHPEWQNQILDIYKEFAIKNNNQFIIATHSPHIAGAVENNSLRLFVNENNQIKVAEINELTLGKTVNELLLGVFDVEHLRNPLIDTKITQLHNLIKNNEFSTTKFKDLFAELSDTLGANDNELILMKLEIARKIKDSGNEKDN